MLALAGADIQPGQQRDSFQKYQLMNGPSCPAWAGQLLIELLRGGNVIRDGIVAHQIRKIDAAQVNGLARGHEASCSIEREGLTNGLGEEEVSCDAETGRNIRRGRGVVRGG